MELDVILCTAVLPSVIGPVRQCLDSDSNTAQRSLSCTLHTFCVCWYTSVTALHIAHLLCVLVYSGHCPVLLGLFNGHPTCFLRGTFSIVMYYLPVRYVNCGAWTERVRQREMVVLCAVREVAFYYYYYYYYYNYYYYLRYLLYAGYLHLYSWDKPCP
jgi:hypothetical protein